MFSKYIVPALAATNLLNGVEASSRHRHMHKRDVVYAATEVEVATVYETVTVYAGEEAAAATAAAVTQSFFAAHHGTSAAADSVTSEAAAATTAPVAVAEPVAASSATTLATVVQSESPVVEKVSTTIPQTTAVPTTYAATTTAAAASTSKAASTGSSSSGAKRGLGYNDASLVSTIVSAASTTFGWCYDWGFTNGGLTASVDYIPMLWGPTHYDSSWDSAAEAAVSSGTEALFSFNECDNAGQANLDAATAASYHKQYLVPYKGQIKIGAPSITSSESTGQGLDWLSDFFTSCGSDCVDFINLHWYGPGGEEGAQEFLNYLVKANTQTGYNVWVTEFGTVSGDEDAFLTYALDQLDNNSTFSFVEKYAYFYLAEGYLFDSTTTLSSAGSIYASAS